MEKASDWPGLLWETGFWGTDCGRAADGGSAASAPATPPPPPLLTAPAAAAAARVSIWVGGAVRDAGGGRSARREIRRQPTFAADEQEC